MRSPERAVTNRSPHAADAPPRRSDLIDLEMTDEAIKTTKAHRHVDLRAGALERKRRRARTRPLNFARRAMPARRSVVG
jgi:hypothetical protein